MTADGSETPVDYVGGVVFPAITDITGMVHYAGAAGFLLSQGIFFYTSSVP
jgi:hypothetical protein